MKKQGEVNLQVNLKPIKLGTSKVKVAAIDGSTYIPHRLNKDTVNDMIGREVGKAKTKKIRDLNAEYESCFYYTEDNKYGVPAAAFMGSILDAAVACDIPKTKIKRAFKILGDILPLKYVKVVKRVDTVRRSGMTAAPDIRHRPEFHGWSCTLNIQYDMNQVSADQIINLINQAGFSSGIGDWRPSSPKSCGSHGMFKVVG